MKLSIVIPIFNSSDIIEELHQRIINTVDIMKLKNDFELILINDLVRMTVGRRLKSFQKLFIY